MTRFLTPLALAAALTFVVAGCDASAPSDAAPTATLAAPAELQTVPGTVVLNGYTVRYLGATAVAGGTEFAYEVTGIDPAPPALDWFFLENACGVAPTAVVPSNAVDPAATVDGMAGVKWTASLPAGTSRIYRYTVAGAEEGVARLALQRGGVLETAALPGPCGGYRLDGSVFVDGDGAPGRGADELGLGNVRVEVYDGPALVAAEATAADGSFAFLLPEGTYDVRVPALASGAFNATLYGSYAATGGPEPVGASVALTADVADVAFGFAPESATIVADLTTGAFRTQARDVKFWQQAVRRAQHNQACDPADPATVCRAELEALLAQIFSADGDGSAYLLDDPYALPAGVAPLDHTAALLSNPAKGSLEVVTRNLFAMELNRLRGWGSPDAAYDDALMAYLEGWVARGGSELSVPLALQAAAEEEPGGGGGGGGVEEESMTTAYLGGGGGGGGVEESP